MKNSLILLFAIALLGFISCGEDDGDAAGCPDGFEGDNCTEQVNTKFIDKIYSYKKTVFITRNKN